MPNVKKSGNLTYRTPLGHLEGLSWERPLPLPYQLRYYKFPRFVIFLVSLVQERKHNFIPHVAVPASYRLINVFQSLALRQELICDHTDHRSSLLCRMIKCRLHHLLCFTCCKVSPNFRFCAGKEVSLEHKLHCLLNN